jgi:hypothetical protein
MTSIPSTRTPAAPMTRQVITSPRVVRIGGEGLVRFEMPVALDGKA